MEKKTGMKKLKKRGWLRNSTSIPSLLFLISTIDDIIIIVRVCNNTTTPAAVTVIHMTACVQDDE